MEKTRCIIVPLNKNAMIELNYGLDYNEANENDYKLWFVNQGVFDNLWNSGIFKDINLKCKTLIDDYEEECIEGSKLTDVLNIFIDKKYQNNKNILELKQLIELAIAYDTCINFAF